MNNFDGQHYWKIGKAGYSLSKIINNIQRAGFKIEKTYRVFAFPSWTTSGITPYEALAVGKKVVWTSEADEPVLGDEHVFVAEPNVVDFAKGLEEALNTDVEGKVDLSDYTWEKYFETVYGAVIGSINK